jgi:tetratricopeptide (TPR) repeat protein
VPAGKRPSAAMAIAFSIAFSSSAFADFQDDYARGLSAYDQGRNLDARRYLQSALSMQPDPIDKVRLNGNIDQPYIPYHFLGLISARLGECDQAAKEWESATHRKMISRFNMLRAQEQQILIACKATLASKEEKKETPVADAVEPVAPAKPPETPATKTAADKKIAAADAKKSSAIAAHANAPAPLVRAFDDFVAGHYGESARVDPEFFTDNRGRFQAYLLRSASRYMLSQIGGDRNLLEEARSDAHAAQALDKTAPDTAVFSPRFRAFYGGAQ